MAISERHTFTVENDSTISIAEQPDQVKADTDRVILATIKHHGIEWQDGHGGAPGYFPGLEERLTERLEDSYVPPKCDKVGECVLKLRVTTDGDVANTQVLVSCPAMEFDVRAYAQAQEEKCEETHAEVAQYVANAMHSRAVGVETLETELSAAKTKLRIAQENIQNYI